MMSATWVCLACNMQVVLGLCEAYSVQRCKWQTIWATWLLVTYYVKYHCQHKLQPPGLCLSAFIPGAEQSDASVKLSFQNLFKVQLKPCWCLTMANLC